jgi:uridine kinase
MSERTIVGIGGGSAAGKTTLAEAVEARCDDVTLLSMDDFYSDRSHMSREERARFNFDDPQTLDWTALFEVTQAIYDGETKVQKPVYDFETAAVDYERITVGNGVLIEGLWALAQALVDEQDFSVYVDAAPDTRLIRRVERDIDERNMDAEEVVRDFKNNVKPMHDKHVEPTKADADIIVQGGYQEAAADAIGSVLE